MNRFLLFALTSLLFAASAQAQFELRSSNFNGLYQGSPAGTVNVPVGGNQGAQPQTPANSNFRAVGAVSGSSGPVSAITLSSTGNGTTTVTVSSTAALLRGMMVSDTVTGAFITTPARIVSITNATTYVLSVSVPNGTRTFSYTRLPSDGSASRTPVAMMTRSTIGGGFASGVPRYFLGDEITPPLVQADGVTPFAGANEAAKLAASRAYWRSKPVESGESFAPFFSTSGGVVTSSTPITSVSVTVTSSNTSSTQITTSTKPAELVIGASILGQPITAISGTGPFNVTLAGNANEVISGSLSRTITPSQTYYYSPHAEKVFANQPGRVNMLWVTLAPTSNGGYQTMTETFAVSSNTNFPVRTIFWTEASFDGPRVTITDGRITTVNPAYYSTVPKAVAQEVSIPGYNPPTPTLTTLSFDKFNGVGQLRAHNVEGRIFVEYLGNVRLAPAVYDHIGFDIVELVRVPDVSYPIVNLGKELKPHDGDEYLKPAPVIAGQQAAADFYGTNVRPDGSLAYFAERETSPANNPDNGSPASVDAFNKVVFYWLQTGSFSIQWPKFQDRYWQRWSPNLSDYAHYTVDPTGSTVDTGIAFTGPLPQIVYQDDPAESEATINLAAQRLIVTLAPPDTRNRALLKFNGGGKVWYVNLYSQSEERSLTRTGSASSSTTVTLTGGATTVGLEVGMVVTGPGISGTATIVSITDNTRFVLSSSITGSGTFALTVESDATQPIVNASATVGTRILPPAGHEAVGYIDSGTCYYPAGYLNPFTVGVAAARLGAIIPVNARSTDNVLRIRWFKRITAPSADFQDLYVAGKIGRYLVSYPSITTPQIVIAQGVGTDDLVEPEKSGSVYYQNSSTLPGFNPNEEHAFMLGGRAYALRDDLNTATTSQAFVLTAFTANDGRPDMRAYKVVRTGTANSVFYDFDYTATAGTLLVKPYPLPLLPQPLVNGVLKDIEIVGANPPTNGTVSSAEPYTSFTFKDRKGFTWIHRGAHNGGTGTLTMKLYYPVKANAGFFIPGIGEPAVGTILPFLRASGRTGTALSITSIDNNQIDEPLPIIYRPTWPTDAPELRVGETLTLPKFGLPQVRGQASAQVHYQQSIALAATNTVLTRNAVTLHDPTREKIIAIDDAAVGLAALPAALKTTVYQGKTYFQGLPPQLAKRFYYDPLRGTKGTLILTGEFHDEIAGEDYLDLNVLSLAEIELLKGLVATGKTDKSNWDAAITEILKTTNAQFVYNANTATWNVTNTAGTSNSAFTITDSNTVRDSYALTATGQGAGYVTLVFGQGGNPGVQPEGDPVAVQVIKVAPQLYVGDLKVVTSANPLDEQVALRHSGDFAAKPENYEFEWRWATGAASAPETYVYSMRRILGDPVGPPISDRWVVVTDPGRVKASAAQYTAAGAANIIGTRNVRPVNYVLDAQGNPTSTVITATSYTNSEMADGKPSLMMKSSVGVDFNSTDYPAGVPETLIFSANIGTFDGFVLYVNGTVALAHNAPEVFFTTDVGRGQTNTNASSGLSSTSLTKQFNLPRSYFSAGPNMLEIAIYTTAPPNSNSSLDFRMEAAQEVDTVAFGTVWETPSAPFSANYANTNLAIISSDSKYPFGGPQFVLNDRWFTMRYRAKQFLADGTTPNPAYALTNNGTYSRWMPPQFVEGWIKRVLAQINPFEQRVKDLYNNAINTDVSVLTQAGTRWEGDVALTLDNIDDVGLIAIYETVLNRGKNMSINANTNDPDTNNALILAAGYLNDLYTILGNEAYADAANPTISLDDQTTVTEVNTSRFSFEGQVASSLEEELALLKGRDDFVSPGVITAPFYNRLVWNYTRGINSGEVLYAVNYNIKEKVGSSSANGVIDEIDAYRMFPQAHGDAYGHYLTALTGYYQLLTNTNFTWTPRAEAVTVAGQPVTVDFQDERKFAAAAGNIARTAEQVVALTYRQSYQDDPGSGWSHYRDSKGNNSQTGTTSRQGLDEWVSRSTQGAYLNWVVGNALVPDVDTNNTGVQKIDRTTVPELPELAATAISFQTAIDNANAHLNPLGLSPGAIAFDISPSDMQSGKSHFEQVYDRSLRTLVNAAGAFNQAAKMTRSLRNQQNQIDDYNTSIEQQETSYVNQLIDIFGRPYSGEIGASKLYAQGYVGPDLTHWYIIDRATDLVSTTQSVAMTIPTPVGVRTFTNDPITDLIASAVEVSMPSAVNVLPNQFAQFNDTWKTGGIGSRAETGALQAALADAQRAQMDLLEMNRTMETLRADFTSSGNRFIEIVNNHIKQVDDRYDTRDGIIIIGVVQKTLEAAADTSGYTAELASKVADATAEFAPTVLGLANDATSAVRGAAKVVGTVAWGIGKALELVVRASARYLDIAKEGELLALDARLAALGFKAEELQLAYEYQQLYRQLTNKHFELAQRLLTYQRANENVRNVIAKGNRLLADREVFRQRAAAIIQGYRTKDVTFRMFRNEALEQYRSLFDLASRYTYLAAKSYDYETGLLGSTQGQTVFRDIVAARSLGDVTAGTPLSTVSSLGDSGLAGSMAKLNADFSVAEGRLGINNPDQYGTVFSLRQELFRLLPPGDSVAGDDAWRQTLERHIVANIMTDSDVATYCMNAKKANGTPAPGIIIPFTSTIQQLKNYFGVDLAGGDHSFSTTNFATKIYNVGIAMPGYIGMDAYASGNVNGAPASNSPNSLSATPYVYLIPCGNDYMLAPPLGDTNTLRSWTVHDQALPLPYNLGATNFNTTQFFDANGTLSSQPWILRKHQAFRAVENATFFYSSVPAEFTNSRLIGRSVWNGQWKIVIPAYTLLSNEQTGLDRFTATVKDIQLFLRTYSHSGN